MGFMTRLKREISKESQSGATSASAASANSPVLGRSSNPSARMSVEENDRLVAARNRPRADSYNRFGFSRRKGTDGDLDPEDANARSSTRQKFSPKSEYRFSADGQELLDQLQKSQPKGVQKIRSPQSLGPFVDDKNQRTPVSRSMVEESPISTAAGSPKSSLVASRAQDSGGGIVTSGTEVVTRRAVPRSSPKSAIDADTRQNPETIGMAKLPASNGSEDTPTPAGLSSPGSRIVSPRSRLIVRRTPVSSVVTPSAEVSPKQQVLEKPSAPSPSTHHKAQDATVPEPSSTETAKNKSQNLPSPTSMKRASIFADSTPKPTQTKVTPTAGGSPGSRFQWPPERLPSGPQQDTIVSVRPSTLRAMTITSKDYSNEGGEALHGIPSPPDRHELTTAGSSRKDSKAELPSNSSPSSHTSPSPIRKSAQAPTSSKAGPSISADSMCESTTFKSTTATENTSVSLASKTAPADVRPSKAGTPGNASTTPKSATNFPAKAVDDFSRPESPSPSPSGTRRRVVIAAPNSQTDDPDDVESDSDSLSGDETETLAPSEDSRRPHRSNECVPMGHTACSTRRGPKAPSATKEEKKEMFRKSASRAQTGLAQTRGSILEAGSPQFCPGFENDNHASELMKALAFRRQKTITLEQSWGGQGAKVEDEDSDGSSEGFGGPETS